MIAAPVTHEALSSAAQPATLWEYYKRCKASGFLAVLPMLTPATSALLGASVTYQTQIYYGTDPHVVEYRRLGWSQRRLVPTSVEHTHLWPVYVQHVYIRLGTMGPPDEPTTWRDVRADVFHEMFYNLRSRNL